MILGLSLIIAFLSYLIYRRLCAEVATSTGARGTSTSRDNTFPAIPMWPFLSALLYQQPPTATSTTVKWPSSCLPEPVGPAVSSPNSTPRATPAAAPTIQLEDIPQISLSAPTCTVEINVISDGDDDDEDDYVPSFPSLNSAQRASGGISSLISPASNPTSSLLSSSKSASLFMPPPPIPIRGRNPKGTVRYATIPQLSPSPPSAASVLRQNPNGTARSRLVAAGIGASGVAAGNGLTLPKSRGTVPSEMSKNRKKVILEPGHSPLDWARLQRSGIDLRVHITPKLFGRCSSLSWLNRRLTGLFSGSTSFSSHQSPAFSTCQALESTRGHLDGPQWSRI